MTKFKYRPDRVEGVFSLLNVLPGDIFYDKHYKHHVVAILDETPEKIIVTKAYGRGSRKWFYLAHAALAMKIAFEYNNFRWHRWEK